MDYSIVVLFSISYLLYHFENNFDFLLHIHNCKSSYLEAIPDSPYFPIFLFLEDVLKVNDGKKTMRAV